MNISLLCTECAAELNLEYNSPADAGPAWSVYDHSAWMIDSLGRRLPDIPAVQAIRNAAAVLGWQEEVVPGPVPVLKMRCPEHVI
jgi:hypothetical protein